MSQLKKFVAALSLAAISLAPAAVFASEATEFVIDINSMSATTRAEILQMLKDARAAGRIPHGEAGLVFMMSPGMAERARVRAEAIEARRLGLIVAGEASPPTATPEQLQLIKAAGERAVQAMKAMMLS